MGSTVVFVSGFWVVRGRFPIRDPNNFQCSREEALLMDLAARTNQVLETLSPQEADFMVQHRDVIQTFLSYGSGAIGVGASIFKSNLDSVGSALRDIEVLQQATLQRDGHLRSPAFFAERQRLLAQLNSHMTALPRRGYLRNVQTSFGGGVGVAAQPRTPDLLAGKR